MVDQSMARRGRPKDTETQSLQIGTATIALRPNQQRVFEYLQNAQKAVGAYHVAQGLGLRCSTTVYRALADLSRLGLVHRIELTNTYAASRDIDEGGHPVMLVCAGCAGVQELAAETVASGLRDIAAEHDFRPNKLTMEIIGRCVRCGSGQTPKLVEDGHLATYG